jgi:hypothetical protein
MRESVESLKERAGVAFRYNPAPVSLTLFAATL